MTRAKRTNVKSRHKKILNKTKGFIGRRKSCYRIAKQAYIKSLIYSRRDRRRRHSILRRNNITKINYFLRRKFQNITYSKFIFNISKKTILNRKILCEIINKDYAEAFYKKLLL
ncbi:50S ribosomal protein L20 [Candidatus Vidania fulgoroideorum]